MKPADLDRRMEAGRIKGTLLEHALVCDRCRLVLERLLLDEGTVKHVIGEGVFPPMRAQMELQRAHDLLGQVLKDRALRERFFPDEIREGMAAMAGSCLCWMLNHTHANDHAPGESFGRLLIELEGALREEGYVLREIVKERKPPEPALFRKDPAPLEFEFGNDEE